MSETAITHTSDEDLATIGKLISGSKVAMFTTMTADGQHESRPLVVQEAEFNGELWFLTQDTSAKAAAIAHHPKVNVSFQSSKGFLSIAGTAELFHDDTLIDEFWSPALEAWFPEGREDPTIALIRVRPDAAEYWYSDEPGLVAAAKGVKAILTGGQPDIGENKTVQL